MSWSSSSFLSFAFRFLFFLAVPASKKGCVTRLSFFPIPRLPIAEFAHRENRVFRHSIKIQTPSPRCSGEKGGIEASGRERASTPTRKKINREERPFFSSTPLRRCRPSRKKMKKNKNLQKRSRKKNPHADHLSHREQRLSRHSLSYQRQKGG